MRPRPRPARRPAGRATVLLTALAIFLLGLLIAALPRGLDGEQARLCRAALPGIEPDGRITVLSIETDGGARHGIRIVYRIRIGAAERSGELRCAFAGGRFDQDRLKLLGLETLRGPLGEARLFMLERFWLGDPQALREGERRLDGLVGLRPLLPIDLPRPVGYLMQQVASGLPLGAFYGLMAAAFALLYGLTGRINLAFGEMALLGAYAAAGTILAFGSGLAGGPLLGAAAAVLLALGAAATSGALSGMVIGRQVLDPLSRVSPRAFLIASIGLSFALLEALRLFAGSRDRWIQPLLNDPVQLFGGSFAVTITLMQAIEVTVAAVVLPGLLALMARSGYGRAFRATADDPRMAALLGVDRRRLAVVTFAISAGLAGLAGGLSALHYGQASYGAGLMITLKALMAAVLGGVGSIGGAAAGGLAIGLAETFWAAYLPNAWRDGAVLALLVLLLVFRPDGLFGRPRPPAVTADRRWDGKD